MEDRAVFRDFAEACYILDRLPMRTGEELAAAMVLQPNSILIAVRDSFTDDEVNEWPN